jgi:hypothetical protein
MRVAVKKRRVIHRLLNASRLGLRRRPGVPGGEEDISIGDAGEGGATGGGEGAGASRAQRWYTRIGRAKRAVGARGDGWGPSSVGVIAAGPEGSPSRLE